MACEWPTVRLGDVSELRTGFPFKSQLYTDETSGPRLLRGDNVTQGRIRWDGAKRWPLAATAPHDAYWLREDDVVIAMDRPWIEAGLKYASIRPTDLPALLVQRVARLRGSSRLETRYLAYVIGSRMFTDHVLAIQTGTAVPHISGEQIRSFEFPLPPLAEQRRIAQILRALDDKIELNRRMSETLEAMARALFKSWFVDFDPVRAKAEGRDPGLPRAIADLFPDRFEESALGPMPEGWRVKPLSVVASLAIGGDWGRDTAGDGDVGVRCLRGVDLDSLRRTGWSDAPLRYVSVSSLEKRRPNSTDVLVEGSGKCGRSLAYSSALAGVYAEPIVYSNFCKRLITGSSEMAVYVQYVLNSLVESGEMEGYITGTAMPNLDHHGLLNGQFLVVPPASVLEIFGSFIYSVRARLFSPESRTLAVIRDTLLPKLISGEVRVPQAERLLEASPA